jgi:hypothetical protein
MAQTFWPCSAGGGPNAALGCLLRPPPPAHAALLAPHSPLRIPSMGHCRGDPADESLRVWSVYSYLIVYRPEQRPIEIVRIVGGYQDIPHLFAPEQVAKRQPGGLLRRGSNRPTPESRATAPELLISRRSRANPLIKARRGSAPAPPGIAGFALQPPLPAAPPRRGSHLRIGPQQQRAPWRPARRPQAGQPAR